METSPELKDIATALSKAQAEFPPFKKEKTVTVRTKSGAEYSYSYADLGLVIKTTAPILSANGLIVTQSADYVEDKIVVVSMLLHTSGQFIKSTLRLPMVDDGKNVIQSIGSSITYGRRYALGALLGIASEADDDGNSAGERGAGKKGTGKKTPPPAQTGGQPGGTTEKKTPCPKCGKTEPVMKSKFESGGWYCFARKGGCGAQWGQTAKAGDKGNGSKTPPKTASTPPPAQKPAATDPGQAQSGPPVLDFIKCVGMANAIKTMDDVDSCRATFSDAVDSEWITEEEQKRALAILEKCRTAKKIGGV